MSFDKEKPNADTDCMVAACAHRLCELIGGGCRIAIQRSRGCRSSGWSKAAAPEVLDEVRGLVAVIIPAIDSRAPGDGVRAAAVRLARLVRAEALEERNLLAHARDDDPALAELLAPLVVRRALGSTP